MACGLCFTVASGVVLFVLCVRALHVLKSTRAYVCLVLQRRASPRPCLSDGDHSLNLLQYWLNCLFSSLQTV